MASALAAAAERREDELVNLTGPRVYHWQVCCPNPNPALNLTLFHRQVCCTPLDRCSPLACHAWLVATRRSTLHVLSVRRVSPRIFCIRLWGMTGT